MINTMINKKKIVINYFVFFYFIISFNWYRFAANWGEYCVSFYTYLLFIYAFRNDILTVILFLFWLFLLFLFESLQFLFLANLLFHLSFEHLNSAYFTIYSSYSLSFFIFVASLALLLQSIPTSLNQVS